MTSESRLAQEQTEKDVKGKWQKHEAEELAKIVLKIFLGMKDMVTSSPYIIQKDWGSASMQIITSLIATILSNAIEMNEQFLPNCQKHLDMMIENIYELLKEAPNHKEAYMRAKMI